MISMHHKIEIHKPRLNLVDLKTYQRGSLILSSMTTRDSEVAREYAKAILVACDEYDKINKDFNC